MKALCLAGHEKNWRDWQCLCIWRDSPLKCLNTRQDPPQGRIYWHLNLLSPTLENSICHYAVGAIKSHHKYQWVIASTPAYEVFWKLFAQLWHLGTGHWPLFCSKMPYCDDLNHFGGHCGLNIVKGQNWIAVQVILPWNQIKYIRNYILH